METVNNMVKKNFPSIEPYIQIVLLYASCFYCNMIVAIKCISKFVKSFSTLKFSVSEYNKIVNDEIGKSNNPLVYNFGVWICLLFQFRIMMIIFFDIMFNYVFLTISYFVIWCCVEYVREKYGNHIYEICLRYGFIDLRYGLIENDKIADYVENKIKETVENMGQPKTEKLD
jgi:hypothetical protein